MRLAPLLLTLALLACSSPDTPPSDGGATGGSTDGGPADAAIADATAPDADASDAGSSDAGPDDAAADAAPDAAACTLVSPYSTKNATCNACAEASCCAEINACLLDAECDDGYVNCAIGCAIDPGDAGPDSCLDDCGQQYPKGQMEYDAAIGCADAQCLVLILAMTALKKNPTLGELLVPAPTFATTSNAGFRREPDKTWRDFVNVWIDFNKGLGLVRSVIVANMELVGISESDFPPGVTL